MTFGSLFAGIGGFDLGFERAGMECRWQVEIDPYCQKVLNRHWPNVGKWDDVRTFPPAPAEDWHVDVICGGFPCQDISDAGKKTGIHGKESGLFFEAIRVVDQLRPKRLVLENVAAILLRRRGMDAVLREMARLGYVCEWGVLHAAGVGANHRRARMFLYAHTDRGHTTKKWTPMGRSWRVGRPEDATKVHVVGRDQTTQEPGIHRVANGVPNQLDRLRGLGNSIVPQVAEWIGKRIVEHGKDEM